MRRWKSLPAILVAIASVLFLGVMYLVYARSQRVWVIDRSNPNSDFSVAPEDAAIARAVVAGDAALVKRLLISGANPNAVFDMICDFGDFDQQNPIHWAAERGDCGVLRALIEGGADPNSRNTRGETPLIKLDRIRSADVLSSCIDALCRAGADPDASDHDYCPLHLAAIWDNTKYAELLLDHGANVNALDGSACTPMIVACAFLPNTFGVDARTARSARCGLVGPY